MRNINRIPMISMEIRDLWTPYCPDWRFGQLMYNFIAWYGDPFYLEDDAFIAKLEEYLKESFPNKIPK